MSVLSVRELLEQSQQHIEVVAGQPNLGRIITWAHVVDIRDPWRWVKPGDLMMTTATAFPAASFDRAAWVRRLADEQISALILAPEQKNTAKWDEAIAAADVVGLPVLWADYDIPFNELAHLVVEQTLREHRQRLDSSERLLTTYTDSLRHGESSAQRLAMLLKQVGDTVVIDQEPTQPDEWFRIDLPSREEHTAWIHSFHEQSFHDSSFLWHWSALVALELTVDAVQDNVRGELGAGLLEDLLQGQAGLDAARSLLSRFGLNGPLRVAIRESPDTTHSSRRWMDIWTGRSHLRLEKSGLQYVLFDGAPPNTDAVSEGFTPLGVSAEITPGNPIPAAAAQARSALMKARQQQRVVFVHGESDDDPTQLVDLIDSARARVRRVLGPLIRHDDQHRGELLTTLQTLLESDGRMRETAEILRIHRQTLAYRLKTIERLTGWKPGTSRGTVEFMLALDSYRELRETDGLDLVYDGPVQQ